MKLGKTPQRDLALLAAAIVLMLGGAVTLIAGWLGAGIAIPLITAGLALVALAQRDIHRQRQRLGHVPST